MKEKLTKETVNKRLAIFNEAKNKLKKDFYGIDTVIDNIFNSIKTWYLYPEFMNRPCIVNLWGLTGVGKTDLISKLRNYLKIEKYASTEMDNSSNTIEDYNYGYCQPNNSKGIFDLLGYYNINPKDQSILLLDEIHRYRTLDKDGKYINRTRFNDIWKLLSDGCFVDSHYGLFTVNEYIDTLENDYDTIKSNLSSNATTFEDKMNLMMGIPKIDKKELEKEKKDRENQISKNGFIPWEMRKNQITELDKFLKGQSSESTARDLVNNIDIDEEDMNKLRMLKFCYQGYEDMVLGELMTRFTDQDSDSDNKKMQYLKNCSKRIILEWLKWKRIRMTDEYNKMTSEEIRKEDEKYVYRKMLIFICGNVDKDIYKNGNETIDIRNDVKKLFMPEQISRFGNTYIIYPLLSDEAYKEIIYREVKFIQNNLEEEYGTDIPKFDPKEIYEETMKELPQDYKLNGVRPVQSAVQRVLSNKIPNMLIEVMNNEN